MARPLKYRELKKKLLAYDPRFEFDKKRGKGSERHIYHPDIDGRSVGHTITCHGEGDEIKKGLLSSIIRRFKLPKTLF